MAAGAVLAAALLAAAALPAVAQEGANPWLERR